MSKWYSIKAKGQPKAAKAEVLIYGDIGETWWGESITAADFVRDFSEITADEIVVRINSYGGSVSDGIAIYNAIKRHPAHVTIAVDGVAVSIASLIAMAGNTVEIAENALMMIHAPWGVASGNSQQMRDYADLLDTWAEAMASSYMSKSGKSRDEILGLLTDGADHWFTADQAVAEGFADTTTAAQAVAASAVLVAAQCRFQPPQNSTIPAAAAAHTPEPIMPELTTPQAANNAPPASNNAPAIDVDAIRAQATKDEAERRNGIALAFKPFASREGMAELAAACAADIACTLEMANAKILAKLAEGAEPVNAGRVPNIMAGQDQRDKRIEAGVNAIRARAGLEKMDPQNEFRGLRLLDLARDSLDRASINHRGMDVRAVVAAAFTQGTSDFPILLENTLNKTLQAAYAIAPDTWSRFCKTGSVSDFRANGRYRVGSFGNLDALSELGEFKNKSIPDGEKGSITATTKGNVINISRQAIINDDLAAFVGLADALGRAARRTIEADVYTLLAANPTMSDGVALFHATHKNLAAAGTAVTMAAMEAGRVAMASQLDVSGNDYLDLRPAVWVGPMGYGGDARSVNSAEYDPDTANKLQKPNVVRGLVRDVVDTPRIANNNWYLFADAADAPVLEVAFLDGVSEPYLEQEIGFDVDGTRWKVRLDYGVAAIDWRGAYKNPGA
jgi:ATP-dependent protease ClpP protease subunit